MNMQTVEKQTELALMPVSAMHRIEKSHFRGTTEEKDCLKTCTVGIRCKCNVLSQRFPYMSNSDKTSPVNTCTSSFTLCYKPPQSSGDV